MAAGINDVAKLAGVSISTVSNVMTGNKSVSPKLERKVLEAIEELGYRANPMASGLRSSKTNMIGVIITSFQRVFFGQILKGIQDTVFKRGYMVSVYDSDNDLNKEKKCMQHFAASMLDGVILLSMVDDADPDEQDYFNMLSNLGGKRKKIPVVSLERHIGNANLDVVMSDNYLAACMMMEHLLALGHEKIAHITGPLAMTMCQNRLAGYRDMLERAGIPFVPNRVRNGDFSPTSGYLRMRELLDQAPDITAVFAANDQMAVGAISAIKERGLRVPEDIAVGGFDNIFPTTLISPSLTTIDIAKYQMGVLSAQRVLKRINGEIKGGGETITLKTQLVVRRSTDISANSAWDLASW